MVHSEAELFPELIPELFPELLGRSKTSVKILSVLNSGVKRYPDFKSAL